MVHIEVIINSVFVLNNLISGVTSFIAQKNSQYSKDANVTLIIYAFNRL